MMRTTVNIEDELLREARHRAVGLGEFLSQALRDAIRAPRAWQEAPFRMLTYGSEQAVNRHEPGDFFEALEADDEASLRDPG